MNGAAMKLSRWSATLSGRKAFSGTKIASVLPVISASTKRNLENLEKKTGMRIQPPAHQHHHHSSVHDNNHGAPKQKSFLLNGSRTVFDQRPAKAATVMEQRDQRR